MTSADKLDISSLKLDKPQSPQENRNKTYTEKLGTPARVPFPAHATEHQGSRKESSERKTEKEIEELWANEEE